MTRALLALALLIGLVLPGFAAEKPTLVLGDTRFKGLAVMKGEVEAFLGIPFARPPVGALRWEPPQAPDYSAGVHQATSFAPACYQGDHITSWYRDVVAGFGGDPQIVVAPRVSEDCLYLNIWRPADAESGKLPVIVYVHGGSNQGGWSYEPNYHGHQLASRGAVVVSVAYRLGPFGFFAHPELGSSNFAMQDIAAALAWVQQWIAAAGGDPGRVTVVGESAGASNISLLLAMPGADGLYHRLVHQSAGWVIREMPTLAMAQAQGLALEEAVGAQNLQELRELPAAQLDQAAKAVYADSGFDPVAGDDVLPVALSGRIALGQLPAVDLLIGSNADEWKIYLTPDDTLDGWLEENLPADLHAQAATVLAALGDERRALDAAITGQMYVCPSMDLAAAIDAAGGRSWMYYFSRVRPGDKAAGMGAYHGAELPYVFDTHDSWLPTDVGDRTLTAAMIEYWLSFAHSGDPASKGLPVWPAFTPEQNLVMQLDTHLQLLEHPSAPLCALLEQQ
ncbi:carboxylesterase family protein [Pseudohalioglobus sediminis]|uniref:Carboxylesterase family protein n=1 Tax=Pseudohalioglobus sediminis TaxID=2606449 RepID=A0A5B0WQE5_9GAMM|nr:carboxylesterase family protein [Pseudohalioglobus sediminis]KAA1188401.1 carboxylesterase family protein [Pseudohalioglobus sediminis]